MGYPWLESPWSQHPWLQHPWLENPWLEYPPLESPLHEYPLFGLRRALQERALQERALQPRVLQPRALQQRALMIAACGSGERGAAPSACGTRPRGGPHNGETRHAGCSGGPRLVAGGRRLPLPSSGQSSGSAHATAGIDADHFPRCWQRPHPSRGIAGSGGLGSNHWERRRLRHAPPQPGPWPRRAHEEGCRLAYSTVHSSAAATATRTPHAQPDSRVNIAVEQAYTRVNRAPIRRPSFP